MGCFKLQMGSGGSRWKRVVRFVDWLLKRGETGEWYVEVAVFE